MIAGLGGFFGRKPDDAPKALWEGMQKVRAFAMALARQAADVKDVDEMWANRVDEGYRFRMGGRSVQTPSNTSAAMPMDSPRVGWG